MFKGVYVGQDKTRLKRILKRLEEESSIEWFNGTNPLSIMKKDFPFKHGSAYLVVETYDEDSPESFIFEKHNLGLISVSSIGMYNMIEMAPNEFIDYVKNICPKEEFEFKPGHIYYGEFKHKGNITLEHKGFVFAEKTNEQITLHPLSQYPVCYFTTNKKYFKCKNVKDITSKEHLELLEKGGEK